MNKYGVWVTRTITESSFIVVEAADEELAEQMAYDKRLEIEYQTDEGNEPLDYSINVEIWEELT